MSDENSPPEEVVAALRNLASYMVYTWRPRGLVRKGLSAFCWWFPHHFLQPASWRIKMTMQAIKRAHRMENVDAVLKELERLADKYPVEVTDCLWTITNAQIDESTLHFVSERSFNILRNVKSRVSNDDSRRKIREIADHLGSLGQLRYREFVSSMIL